ncbi:hypothetical protein FEV53_12810 [Palleronia caenipelagi]|uniref:Uncharacterized protein n=2 Tax=Palleronia caenipelagi TaxID=2489174 RepID=A0A547PUI1_9RHOB|nr:hypothetical protein FEV53_12810 [Palleronia caenipelagi]
MIDWIRQFARDERGTIEAVMYIGIIALPLVMFLAIFGKDVIDWIREVAPRIFDEGATFLD